MYISVIIKQPQLLWGQCLHNISTDIFLFSYKSWIVMVTTAARTLLWWWEWTRW